MFKRFIQRHLESYVVKYFQAHPEVKLVVVTGSVGKTSTKRAVATLLSQRYRVRMLDNNHNTDLSAPCGILGVAYPVGKVHSVGAWLRVFRAAHRRVVEPTDVDIIVQELGTDHPGEIADFGRYLRPDLAIVTAVTPEHMEFFGSIDEVAREELEVASYSRQVLLNRDDIEGRFAKFITNPNFSTYGTTGLGEYRFEQHDFTAESGYRGMVITPSEVSPSFMVSINVVGEHSLRPVMGAVAAALHYGVTPEEIVRGLQLIRPVPGRMNPLIGIGGTTIIDDTYNSSPAAALAALQTLYSFSQASQRIAILGDMNELGASSQSEHEKLGAACSSSLLDWVVTVGPEAGKYIAPAAQYRGCQVKVCRDAIEAGRFVRSVSQAGSVILVKGSQGGIFLEEAVKILCVTSEDVELVRQSPEWMAIKAPYFSQYEDFVGGRRR